ncbi:MAG TPA: hypothetical protein VLF39_00745 [Candidatus Saccharimonadales bacterium]|nr:hypothetical protein [Candidatus Saccharimonadales bacterium]
MDHTYWHKQSADKPLYSDLIWSRPENKRQAGKLLIIGGNLYGFAAPAEAFTVAEQAGVGMVRVLLPQALKKTVGKVLDASEFAANTPSGSFAQSALSEFLDQANWADGTLIAGDLGRNSETAIIIEKFLSKHAGHVTLTKDAVDYLTSNPAPLINRGNVTLVLSLSQLQRLVKALKYPQPITYTMPLLRLVDLLADFSQSYPINIMTKHYDQIMVAVGGQISTTPDVRDNWQVKTAASSAVWWLQNPTKPFQALTTAIYNDSM